MLAERASLEYMSRIAEHAPPVEHAPLVELASGACSQLVEHA